MTEEKTKKLVVARITDPLGLELEVVTPLVVSASARMSMERLNLTQKHQAHILETHHGHLHQLLADDETSEVKLLAEFVPSDATSETANSVCEADSSSK